MLRPAGEERFLPDHQRLKNPWLLFLWHGLLILVGLGVKVRGGVQPPLQHWLQLPYPLLQHPGSAHGCEQRQGQACCLAL